MVIGKTVEKGMRFEGSDLFIVETKEKKTDNVKVKMKSQNSKEDYFTVKVSFNRDGTRNDRVVERMYTIDKRCILFMSDDYSKIYHHHSL